MPILSFAHVYRGCVEGNEESWRDFARMFLPLTAHLVKHSFRDLWPDEETGAAEFFSHLRKNHAERLLPGQQASEKAFLMYLRDELFAFGRGKRGETAPLGMTHEQFIELLNGFPPIPREAVVMLSKGYGPKEFAVVLHMEEASAEQAVRQANEKLEAMGVGARLPAPVGSGFDRLLEHLESEVPGDPIPVLTFVRMLDGQISWDEKEAADKHMADSPPDCVRYVTYQEVHWFYRDMPQGNDGRVEAVARRMGLEPRETEKRPSLVARMMKPFRGKSASA